MYFCVILASACAFFRNFNVSATSNFMSFSVQNFPIVSSINLFNLGSFLFPAELYHNPSAEALRSIQPDRTDGRRIFLCFIYWRAFPYGLPTAGLAGVACCGKGEKAYWVFSFLSLAFRRRQRIVFGKCTKKGVLVFGLKS